MTAAGDDFDATLLDEILAFSLSDHGDHNDQSILHLHGSSSSSHSSSNALSLTCDLCNTPTSLPNCYLDMVGCSHVLCLPCLHSSPSPPTCPVPSCHNGTLFSPSPTPPAPTNTTIECTICMEDKNPSDAFFDTKGCKHVFCSDCIARYVAAKLDDNAVDIPCPDPACSSGSLELDSCKFILPYEVFARWGAALCERAIDGSSRFYCPYRDCSALVVKEDDGEGGEEWGVGGVECPHCNRKVCVRCKVPWHEGVGCEEYQKLGEGERGKEDLMLMDMARRSKWRRCPKCGFFVERVEGCVFIMCRCKYCFCYVCGAPMVDTSHYCSKCKCTWDHEGK